MNVVDTAGAISTYGLYAIVAILLLVVIHLYREHNRLVDEIKQTMMNDSKELAKLLTESNEVIKRNTKAMESMEVVSRQMSEMAVHLRSVVEGTWR